MSWETVIGLEVHVQLATQSKIFSSASTAFGAEPNSQANLVDLGYPGVLPVLNREAVDMAWRFGLAIGAEIPKVSFFARKNYFYPDLPKGYQISQHTHPIVGPGVLSVVLDSGEEKTIRIHHAHLEEDAGKSLHEDYAGQSGIDLNRAGTPLLEIVSEPDLRSAEEAVAYLKKMRSLVRFLKISDGNMQEGSLRCDANVSVRRPGEPLGKRCEVKNLNSFKFIEQAIEYETSRQITILEDGGSIEQQTRLYDPDQHETRAMRSKEEANDYRYFPDPDLLPIKMNEAHLAELRAALPELPDVKCERFQTEYELTAYDANLLTSSRELSEYFEAIIKQNVDAKLAANWINGELSAALNKEKIEIDESPLKAERLAGLLVRISDKTISGNMAKKVFTQMWGSGDSADAIIDAQGLKQVTDPAAIIKLVGDVLDQFPDQLAELVAGKEQLKGFFVGKIMQQSGGRANPEQVNIELQNQIGQLASKQS